MTWSVVRRAALALATTVAVVAILLVSIALVGVAKGYRPVVLQTGSMGGTAPAGSVVIAGPRDGDTIDPGDIVVMQRPGALPITHRVVSVEDSAVGRLATTKGDANAFVDPAPYVIGDEELVARWAVPHVGSWLDHLRDPRIAFSVGVMILVVVTGSTLRRIWRGGRRQHVRARTITTRVPSGGAAGSPGPTGTTVASRVGATTVTVAATPRGTASRPTGSGSTPTPPPPPPPFRPPPPPPPLLAVGATPRRRATRLRLGIATVSVALVASSGVVFSLFSAAALVEGNQFGASDCFGSNLASLQTGETTHVSNGTVTELVTPVDPSTSFVLASVRSSSPEIADSSVQVRLAAGDRLEIERRSDDATPPAVTVVWSIVEYECGIRVQRGTVDGNSTNRIDVAIDSVDAASSFTTVSSLAAADAVSFGPNHLVDASITAGDTLTISGSANAVLDPTQRFSWQVVSFLDSAEIDVQTASGTLGSGDASATIPLASPVDVGATFVLASVISDSTGDDVGERMVLAELVDDSTVVVDRAVAGDAVDVRLQVVTLLDGTTVHHGRVDLDIGVGSTDVSVPGIDHTRSSAISTVTVPGPAAGGLTTHVADERVGEGSATFTLTDPRTLNVTRDASTSDASFAWQVIEWSGPGWWDDAYGFRQRIDVESAPSVTTPDEYTVALTVDHAELVASGFSVADGSDLRVLRWDGETWTELDRVLDDDSDWNLADTTIRFRSVDEIAAGTTATYWLYMNHPEAGAAPGDPARVYLLVEDFDDGTTGVFEDRTGGTDWYRADPWTRRIPLTVAAGSVGSDLVDFPLFVSLTDDALTAAQPDGSDIRFVATDGVTSLAHEIEAFDPVSGHVDAWVRIPTLSASSDTTFDLYVGAGDAPSQGDVRATWNGDVEATWHLSRDPAGPAPQLDDSTVSNHDGLSLGSMDATDLVAGRVGPGLDLDGVDDGIRSGPISLAGRDALTLSAWVRPDALTDGSTVFSKADGGELQLDLVVLPSGAVRARLGLDGGDVTTTTPGGAVTTGTWHHVATVWDGSSLSVWVDGTERADTAAVGALTQRGDLPVTIGNDVSGLNGVDGLLDEVRLDTAARDVAWLRASFDNQSSPDTFVTAGAADTVVFGDQGDWAARTPVVVQTGALGSTLGDVEILVDVVDGRLSTATQACGCDLVFTAADGTTRLDHVVETFDRDSGALTAWVSVPTVPASGDVDLFLYFSNPTAVDQQDAVGVFGPDADLRLLGGA